jgi:hypothetical protein
LGGGTVPDSEGRTVPEEAAHCVNGPLASRSPLGLEECRKNSEQGRPKKLEAAAQGRNKFPKQVSWGSKALPGDMPVTSRRATRNASVPPCLKPPKAAPALGFPRTPAPEP